MEYTDSKSGFSLELSEGWRMEQRTESEGFPRVVFFRNGDLRTAAGIRPGRPGEGEASTRAEALLRDLESRHMQGTSIPAPPAGGGSNIAAVEYRSGDETQRVFSVFRDGVVYQLTHTGDVSGPVGPALDRALRSFRFPGAKQAAGFLRASRPESWLAQVTGDMAKTETEKILRYFHIPFWQTETVGPIRYCRTPQSGLHRRSSVGVGSVAPRFWPHSQ